MRQKLTTMVAQLGLITILSAVLLPSLSLPVYAAACKVGSGGIGSVVVPSWYKYLDQKPDSDGRCRPKFDDSLATSATKIGIAIIEIMTRLAGFVAIGYLLWGGIQYITSQGEPDGMGAAKSTITNAIIGLAVTILAVGIIQFIGNSIRSTGAEQGLPKAFVTNNFTPVVNTVGAIAILLSVAFVTFGGLKYTLAAGDPTGVQKAKNTILYALVGLAVTLSAYAIISFVTGRLN